MSFDIGFVNPKMETRSWKQLVDLHQTGGASAVLYSGSRTLLGQRMARIGGRLKKSGDPDAKFFFLRRTTGRKSMMIPPRPEMQPFWEANKTQAEQNIIVNFHRKMAGERI